MNKQVERLAIRLEETATSDLDIEAAKMLRELNKVYVLAKEIVQAKTYNGSKGAYSDLVDYFKENK